MSIAPLIFLIAVVVAFIWLIWPSLRNRLATLAELFSIMRTIDKNESFAQEIRDKITELEESDPKGELPVARGMLVFIEDIQSSCVAMRDWYLSTLDLTLERAEQLAQRAAINVK